MPKSDSEKPYYIVINQKFWGFPSDNERFATGNFKVEIRSLVIGTESTIETYETVSICNLGNLLNKLVKAYNIRDFDVEAHWNRCIEEYNKDVIFINAFSSIRKKYLWQLFPAPNDSYKDLRNKPVVLAKSMDELDSITLDYTEKALLINVPHIGTKWVPRSSIYSIKGVLCLRKNIANNFDFSNI